MNKRTLALDAAKRASARSISLVQADMKRRLNSLAGIAATAHLLGFLGTVVNMIATWTGLGTEKRTIIPAMARWCADSLVPTAVGLTVMLLAFYGYRCLSNQLESLELEMKTASLDLMDDLFRLTSTNI